MRMCIKCGVQLYGLQKKFCNNCRILGARDRANKYTAKNRDKLRKYGIKYREEHRDKELDRCARYRQSNKEAIKSRRRTRVQQERVSNPIFKIKQNVSRSVRRALLSQSSSKQGHSILKFMPWSLEQLKVHLESQFSDWMSWESYGPYNKRTHDISPTWQIDHIIPHSEFDYQNMNDPNFKKCWDLSNLRPLDAKINLFDGIYRIRHTKGYK
jgi:hypothetical protein